MELHIKLLPDVIRIDGCWSLTGYIYSVMGLQCYTGYSFNRKKTSLILIVLVIFLYERHPSSPSENFFDTYRPFENQPYLSLRATPQFAFGKLFDTYRPFDTLIFFSLRAPCSMKSILIVLSKINPLIFLYERHPSSPSESFFDTYRPFENQAFIFLYE
ncbi:hypothetical protein CEXT_796591 [Caerostris extrusa]|uniref:Uncharacterized protein n=1 Tax=Caerostris extrusa TaxID=172846 RepID=A0AAV4WSG2_CAEEX|nr:hypothetical protein CEXT_796591 [Caerostris extrusa]